MKKTFCLVVFISLAAQVFSQSDATIKESIETIKTYPFSDPNPIPHPENQYYPYFRFDGFTTETGDKDWKVITMENDYIKVSILPEIGGKVWGATEKSTGREFIYDNSVVKFRDIAMRGPWTSGGIEFNFGIIGHAATTSTPVDYHLKKNDDGSVSCMIAASELITSTRWEVEIRLPKDKAYFTTTTKYFNPTPLLQPYYHWANAAYQSQGDLEFCFPGTHWIGHGGELHRWPVDREGRDLSFYKNNAFGSDKSYHVIGSQKEFFAAYWHDFDFGSGHYTPYEKKPGRKIWQWSHARSGAIWEDLLTDTDGQYVELQSGKLFNQAAEPSTKTPFKHFGFQPYTSDSFTEYWFPVISTDGALMANQYGTLNIEKKGNKQTIYFNTLQTINEPIYIYFGDELKEQIDLEMAPLDLWTTTIANNEKSQPLKVILGNNKLIYSEKKEKLDRPFESPEDFDWNSVYGLYLDGLNWVYQGKYSEAFRSFGKCLEKEPYFTPALNSIALLHYRKAEYEKALSYIQKAMSVNTYDPKANFTYGLIQKQLGNLQDAEDGFSIASLTPSHRMAANIEMAKLFMLQDKPGEVQKYVGKALLEDEFNHEANLLMALIERKTGTKAQAGQYLKRLSTLNHFKRFEQWLLDNDESSKMQFTSLIRNELPNETYMEIACWYEEIGATEESIRLLETAPGNLLIDLKLAHLYHLTSKQEMSNRYFRKALQTSPDFVFPSRKTNIPMLEWAILKSDSWKPRYLLGLLTWDLGNINQAKKLFTQCGESPEYYPFYAGKAELFKGEKGYNHEKDLLKARKLGKNDWRTSRNMIDFYLENKKEDKALEIARESVDLFHSHYEVNYALAKSLLANKQYTKCLDVLAKTQMLPSEGASRGRIIYRQAAVMESLDHYKEDDYRLAVQSIDKARRWPENLGVGKPYHPDERLEDFLEAECRMRLGQKNQAMELYGKVIKDTQDIDEGYSSSDFFFLLSLKAKGKEASTVNFMDRWEQNAGNDPVFKWIKAMVHDDINTARTIEKEIATDTEAGTPWNPKNTDPEFELVKKIGYLLKSGQ